MTFNWHNKFSDWNPQFFREIQGRLKRRNLTMTIATSLILQMVLLVFFGSALPDEYSSGNAYCLGGRPPGDYANYYGLPKCLKDSLGHVIINWQKWWFDIFQFLSWTLPFIVLVAGAYLLISDLGKEERRGTLNFIRLSPQSSQGILLGKILGVPAIPYLAVALAIPLHLAAAIAAHVSPLAMLSLYLFTGVVCCFFYTGSLLFALLGGSQGWIGALVVWLSYSVFFQLWQSSHNWSSIDYLGLGQWYELPIGSQLSLVLAFSLLTFGGATYWFWQAANRRFRHPNATLLSKAQSYWISACFEIWMLGFAFRDRSSYHRLTDDFIVFSVFNLLWFLVLIAALTPQRQALLDWARYRRERVQQNQRFWSRSLLKDLVWGEKSPAVFAIGFNLLVMVALFGLWIAFWPPQPDTTERELAYAQLQAFAGLILNAIFILICTTIAQLMMFMPSPKRTVWASGTIAALVILPPVVLGVMALSPYNATFLWLLTALSFATVVEPIAAMTVLFGFLSQLSVLSVLTLRLSRQIRQAGESQSKALMAGSKA